MKRNQLSGSGGKGGGPGSRSLSNVTTYFGGRPSDRVSPAGVSQVGSSIGNHSTDSGKTLRGGVEPVRVGAMPNHQLGNSVAPSTVCGPGGSRSLSKSGSQHGLASSPAPIGPTKDTLNEFGPDYQNAKTRG